MFSKKHIMFRQILKRDIFKKSEAKARIQNCPSTGSILFGKKMIDEVDIVDLVDKKKGPSVKMKTPSFREEK